MSSHNDDYSFDRWDLERGVLDDPDAPEVEEEVEPGPARIIGMVQMLKESEAKRLGAAKARQSFDRKGR